MFATFLSGAVAGAALAMLLSHAGEISDVKGHRLPTSLADAFAHIREGWAHPTLMTIALMRHPLLLLVTQLLLLVVRAAWRRVVLRRLWLHWPAGIKAFLEVHAALLGLVVACLLLGSAIAQSTVRFPGCGAGASAGGAGSGSCREPAFDTRAAFEDFDWALHGLLVQTLLPFFLHPGLAPRLIEVIAARAPSRVREGLLALRSSARRVRGAVRLCYACSLVLILLLLLPLTLEAGVRWWRLELLPSLPAVVASPQADAADEAALAAGAASTLRLLALFAMLRRLGKSIDLQLGHYYGHQEERTARAISVATGAASRRSAAASAQPTNTTTTALRAVHFKHVLVHRVRAGRSTSLLRLLGAPRWLKSFVRSLRWLCVTPPTYLFWAALSAEVEAACGWRRLLLPCLLFAANECGQTARLLALLAVPEGSTAARGLHRSVRLRSAFWLHRLEIVAALHWLTLCAAATAPGAFFGPSPPVVGVLLAALPAALVGVTTLEQLPGDASELAVLLRSAGRVAAPGDLHHLVAQAWYRGLLNAAVVEPEALAGTVGLADAQRQLPWWLRPPLPDARQLRSVPLLQPNLTPMTPEPGSSTARLLGWGSAAATAFATSDSFDFASGKELGPPPTRGASSLFLSGLDRLPSTLGARGLSVGNLRALARSTREMLSPSQSRLALETPLQGLRAAVLAALPDDLASFLADGADVLVRTVFDRGKRGTLERQIREVLRVLGAVASHATQRVLFSWSGRRRLLGGLATLEDMLHLAGEAPPESSRTSSSSQRGSDGVSTDPLPRRTKSDSSCSKSERAPERTALPPLLSLLAGRERRFMAQLRAAAKPVGRHGTGGGRVNARDPFAFGFDGSWVIDEPGEMFLMSLRKRGSEADNREGSGARKRGSESDNREGSGARKCGSEAGGSEGGGARKRESEAGGSESGRAEGEGGGEDEGPSHRETGSGGSSDGGGDDGDGVCLWPGGPRLPRAWKLPRLAMPHPPWMPKPPKPPSSGGLLVQEAVPLSALYDLAGHSYEGRGAELIARRAHAGIEGTSVRVMRYPPSWSCVPPSPRPRAPHHVGPRATLAGLRATRSEGPEPPEEDLKGLPPLWFHATVTARHPKAPEEVQAVDLEYKFCCLEPRFGDGCDTTSLNILLPELCVAIEGLAVDLIDRSSSGVAATSSLPDVISARWEEPTAAEGREGLFGKLSFVLQRPVLFQLVAEARRLSVRGKKALQVLNPLIGTRREMRIEADVELTRLTYSLIFREEEVHWSISDIHLQLARDGSIQCRSAEGGLVEWLLRAVPAKLLEIINKALQDNLRKEQPLFLWRGDAAEIGALDGFYRELSRLAWLKQEVMRSFRDSGAS